MKKAELSKLKFEQCHFTDLLSQSCFPSAFMGTISKVGDRWLLVQTALGLFKLWTNRWTMVFDLAEVNNGNSLRERIDWRTHMRDFVGQFVMGRLIAYPKGASEKIRESICTELYLQGPENGDLPYLSPDFWIHQLVYVADWWLKHAVDVSQGGYYTDLTQDGFPIRGPNETDKWGYVVSRTLYAFSTAFALTGDRRFLDAARNGTQFLSHQGIFEGDGFAFFHTRLDSLGQRHPDDPELVNIFTQIYSLTGLIAYYDISRCLRVQTIIEANLRMLTELYHDNEYGGYYDALSRSNFRPVPGITDSKSFNSIVDPLSATLYFLNNAKFQGSHFGIDGTIRELCDLILRHMVDPEHNFIREIFCRSWEVQEPKWRNPYNTDFDAGNVGGNLKVIWVLLRAMDELPQNLRAIVDIETHRIYNNLLSCGAWDTLRGGWFEVMRRESAAGSFAEHMWHTNKVWWQQEEGIVASLLLHLAYREKKHLNIARDGIRYWLTYFVDRENGGVFDTVSTDGWPLNGLPLNRQKGSWLKGGYHEAELARFVHIYLSILQDQPVTMFYAYDPSRSLADYRSIPARIPRLEWYVLNEEIVDEDLLKVEYGYRWLPKVARRSKV
jgi:mannose/cellobiose epimerase-like protein (N-acyl-D-glucosamine 2-epimerase family)